MSRVRVEFRARARDVIACVRHLQETQPMHGSSRDDGNRAHRALRAACYVMTYNMVEATARSVVESIFERLGSDRVAFESVRRELKVFVLSHARKRSTDDLVTRLENISTDIISSVVESSDLFSGNVDARKLRSLTGKLGYRVENPPKSNALLTVKNYRNDLSHGIKGFSELGRDVSVDELGDHAIESIIYMKAFIRSAERYLGMRSFLQG